MKQLLLLIMAISFTISAPAQKIRLTDTANRWKMNHQLGITGEATYDTYTYKMGADTLIKGIGYRKTEIIDHQVHFDGMYGVGGFGKEYIGSFYRDDTINNRTYCITGGDSVEHLIYDAAWKVGDSVTYSYSFYKGVNKIIKVDSTLILGAWYRVFRILYSGGGTLKDFFIIEGIGCTRGTAVPAYPIAGENGPNLRCFYHAGYRPLFSPAPALWEFDNLKSCVGTYAVPAVGNTDAWLKVVPNPGNSDTRIELPANAKPGFIKLIDAYGRLVACISTKEGKQQVLVGSYLKATGVYYFVFESSDGYRECGQILFL